MQKKNMNVSCYYYTNMIRCFMLLLHKYDSWCDYVDNG